jgi:hypothetical protein
MRAPALWQDVAIPKSGDICLLRPPPLPPGERFETLTDAARIDDANIARLLNFRPDLAAEIERCDEEGEWPSRGLKTSPFSLALVVEVAE